MLNAINHFQNYSASLPILKCQSKFNIEWIDAYPAVKIKIIINYLINCKM